ncbi:hypothetical protein [Nitrosomonas nitrosa]|uniref:hypothetical protein n=1 Tax=Nitrosomonas nitrosa TaxID=52442 RepID=UPI0023F78FE6|nr:hypothetical protein [Nitrosomonas nitrosa]MCO6432758.1 hypothetical protein [Nitrosomonas nitrosa]
MDILTVVFSFIAGAAIGVVIAHSWNTHVAQEAISKLKNLFDRLWQEHTPLLSEIKRDMDNPDYQFQREFYVIKKNQRFSLSLPRPCLVYYLDEHNDLENQLRNLEEHGFVINVTDPNKDKFARYVLSEKFVELLRNKQV